MWVADLPDVNRCIRLTHRMWDGDSGQCTGCDFCQGSFSTRTSRELTGRVFLAMVVS